MTVRYHQRHGTVWPTYVCQQRGIARAEPICQSVPGRGLDAAIGRVLIDTVTPLTLEMQQTRLEFECLRIQDVDVLKVAMAWVQQVIRVGCDDGTRNLQDR